MSALRATWDHLQEVIIGAMGLFSLVAWAIFPVPSRADLTEVNGILASYTIEAEQSWLDRYGLGRRTVVVLFRVADRSGRFWNDSVDPNNARYIFRHSGAALRFYQQSHRSSGLINGDAQKTWGLTVDGSEITSVDDAISHDAFLSHIVLPGLGVLGLIIAGFVWKKTDSERKGNRPDRAPARHAMTTCPYCGLPAMSLSQKSQLSLMRAVACHNCKKLVGVPWWDFMMILPCLLIVVFRHSLALPAIVPFVALGLNFFLYFIVHLYLVPLVRRDAA